MSSSRDHISCTGAPGIALAIAHGLLVEVLRCRRAGRSRRPASSCAPRPSRAACPRLAPRPPAMASPFCVATHTSTRSARRPRGGGLRLHRRVVQVRRLVFGLDHLRRAGQLGLRIAVLRAGGNVRGVEPGRAGIAAIDSLSTLSVASSSHSTGNVFSASVGAPPVVGDDRDAVVLASRPAFTPRISP